MRGAGSYGVPGGAGCQGALFDLYRWGRARSLSAVISRGLPSEVSCLPEAAY